MALLVVAGLVPSTARAAPGDLVQSFGADGRVVTTFTEATPEAIVIQPDGRIVVLLDEVRQSQSHAVVRRFTANGRVDTSFNAGAGEVDLGARTDAIALALDGDRVLVLVTAFDPFIQTQSAVVHRLRPDGRRDRTFAGDGSVVLAPEGVSSLRAVDLAVDERRRPVVLARALSTDSDVIRRLTAAGSPDASFSGDGSFTLPVGNSRDPVAIAVDAKNRPVIASSILTAFDPETGSIGLGAEVTRLTNSGRLDGSLGGTGSVEVPRALGRKLDVKDVGVGPGNSVVILATDTFSNSDLGSMILLRLTPRGGFDRSFSGDGRLSFTFGGDVVETDALVVRSSGGIVAVGTTEFGAAAIAAVRSNGTLDRRFSQDGRRTLRFPGATTSRPQGVALAPGERRMVIAAEVFAVTQRFGMAAVSLV